MHDGANQGLQTLEFRQIILAEGEHDLDVLAQQIEFIHALWMLRKFAFKRRRQPVFDQFAQLLQQHSCARGLLRRLPAQRKNLFKLIEGQHRYDGASMRIEKPRAGAMQVFPETIARLGRGRCHLVIDAFADERMPHLLDELGRRSLETQAQVHR